jgi:hypothetical protein
MKLALPIGKDTRPDVLEEFTRNKEAVLKPVSTAADLKRMLKMISITSTSFASRSGVMPDADGPVTKYDTLLEEVQRAQDEPFDLESGGGIDPETIDYGDDEVW